MKVIYTDIKQTQTHNEIDINSLEVGRALVFNVLIQRADNYIIIIEAGTVLTDTLYTKLQNQDKLYVAKKNQHKQTLSCETLDTYISYNKNDFKMVLSFLYEINNKIFNDFLKSKEDVINTSCLDQIVKSLIMLIKYNPNYLKGMIPHFISEYSILYHSLHVCMYSITLSHFLNFSKEETFQVGKAALMLDLGVKKINDSIIKKKTALTVKELEIVHKHPYYSSEIAKKNFVNNQYILDAIIHHHENLDGTGYPHRIKGDNVRGFAAILSICSVFDALTNNRPHREKHSTFEALKIMMKDESMTGKFKKQYLKVFLNLLIK